MPQSIKMLVTEWDIRLGTRLEGVGSPTKATVQHVYVIYRHLPPLQGWTFTHPIPRHLIIEVSAPFPIEGLCRENGEARLRLYQKIDNLIAEGLPEIEEIEP